MKLFERKIKELINISDIIQLSFGILMITGSLYLSIIFNDIIIKIIFIIIFIGYLRLFYKIQFLLEISYFEGKICFKVLKKFQVQLIEFFLSEASCEFKMAIQGTAKYPELSIYHNNKLIFRNLSIAGLSEFEYWEIYQNLKNCGVKDLSEE